MQCLCAVTLQEYGANHGLQWKGIARFLQLVRRLRALGGRCAEHQKELAAGVTRGSRGTPRETERRGGVAVCVHEGTGDKGIHTRDTGQTEDLRSVTGELHSMVFPLVDFHPGLLEVNRVKLLAMFMFTADNLQP